MYGYSRSRRFRQERSLTAEEPPLHPLSEPGLPIGLLVLYIFDELGAFLAIGVSARSAHVNDFNALEAAFEDDPTVERMTVFSETEEECF